MTLAQFPPKKIYYGEPIIVSDMQGPCPDGFHVPTKDEWGDIYSILITTFGLLNDGATMVTYLKMPMAGRRSSNASTNRQGIFGYYWSSTYQNDSYAYSCGYASGSITPQSGDARCNGYSIRGFKDTPVNPDGSWTVLYQGTGDAGIYHNSTFGLISISGNGTKWYTIMDKNLGATTVYNDGDTLSEANCGGYFQRGNNYMFPFTGSVTTSSTKVDASTYGPGNYYDSSTFITVSSSPSRWDTTDNANLRGGVTQGTSEKPKEIKAVYLGENKVRPTTPPTPPEIYDELLPATTSVVYNSGSNYIGIAFLAKKNCSLNKIQFFYGAKAISGTLMIAKASSLYGASGTTYTLTGNVTNGLYQLANPYQLTANTYYCIGVYGGRYYIKSSGLPKSGTNVDFKYSTYSNSSSTTTRQVFTVAGLYTQE